LYAQDYAQNGYLIPGYQNNSYAPSYMVIFFSQKEINFLF